MFAEKNYPEVIHPEELDRYLSKGWYRMGQTIFTTHFLCFGKNFYSAIWIRLPLEGYTFRKGLRKILRRNQKTFETKVRKASFSAEKENLYQRYKLSFSGVLAPSLRDSLLDGEDFNLYNTYEIAIYEQKKLIGLSFFDLGKNSVASIMGIYDPNYAKHSLGIYTMLEEINFSLNNDKKFYYPGYVVPGYSRFDYKLRIGPVSYYNLKDNSWDSFAALKPEDIPIKLMEEKLGVLEKAFTKAGIPCKKLYYPLFEANLFGFWQAPYFDYPLLLQCYPNVPTSVFLMAIYDFQTEEYQLIQCAPFDDLQFNFNEAYTSTFEKSQYFVDLIIIEKVLLKSPSIETLCKALLRKRKPSN